MTTLVFGGADDEHALHVLEAICARGRDAELLDSRWFPTQMSIEASLPGEGGGFRLPHGRRIPFAAVRSVYWRSYAGVGAPVLPDEQQSYLAYNDARSLFESVLQRLPAKWVNSYRAFQLHQTKPVQLAMVAKLGVRIPETTLTNDPAAVRDFVRRHGECIFKPVQGGAHTRDLTEEQLTDDRLAHLELAPITVQQKISGTNIRAFVAGERVLACEVETGMLDFRDDPEPRIVPHTLPQDVQTQCRRIARTLELHWTGIDFRLMPQGEYFFLEANPSPMFLGFEEASGLPLTESLLEVL
jgi:glutathione synthase/RimK-type ligase-like ATP-grasp enzyme